MHKPENHQPDRDEALEALPGLISALQRLPQEALFIPPTVDEAVLRHAQRRLGKPVRTGPGWLRFMPWMAAAAAVVLLISIPRFTRQRAPGPAEDLALARWDLNHDGQVDILDAFVVARQVQPGQRGNPQLDANGDGVVDERDAAVIAAWAVRLGQGGHS